MFFSFLPFFLSFFFSLSSLSFLNSQFYSFFYNLISTNFSIFLELELLHSELNGIDDINHEMTPHQVFRFLSLLFFFLSLEEKEDNGGEGEKEEK